MEDSMSKAGLDSRHRNKDGEISHKHGNTLIRTLRKVYGQGFAAGYPENPEIERGSAPVERDVTEPTPSRSRNWSPRAQDRPRLQVRRDK
jgi:hypothetical protein